MLLKRLNLKKNKKYIKTKIIWCIYNLNSEKDDILDEEEFEKIVNVEDVELTEKSKKLKRSK